MPPRSPHQPPDPPPLKTLPTKPSWQNRAGRVDRSACLAVTAKHLAIQTFFNPPPKRTRKLSPLNHNHNHNHKRKPNLRLKTPITQGTITITAHHLAEIQYHQLPRTLAGDHRTPRANAMNPNDDSNSTKGERVPVAKSPCHSQTPPPPPPPPNPNKGACRTKVLALPTNNQDDKTPPPHPHFNHWQQRLTILRLPTAPGFHRHSVLCPRCQARAYKLFLPLCTAQEYQDAQLAYAWLKYLDQRYPYDTRYAPATPTRAAIITRYDILFPPRTLLCRHCLALRYAEPTKRKRQHNHPPK